MQGKTVLILAIVVGLFAIVLFLARHRVRKQVKSKQLGSIKLNLLLKSLLLSIQKQRGLCARYSSGEYQLKSEIEQYLDDIEKQISIAEYQYSQFLNKDPRWRSVRVDWALLRSNVFLLDTDNIFVYHNLLIENIIFMMEDIAYKGQYEGYSTINSDEIKAIWSNIPQTLEAIGKTRAIGSGVASQGICSKENKIKLKYLSDEIIKNYNAVYDHLGRVMLDETHGMPFQVAQSIDDFVIIIQDKLIIPEQPEVAAETFFEQATQAMDGVSLLFDTLSTIKEKQITKTARLPYVKSN